MSRRSIKFILAALLATIIAVFGFGVAQSNAAGVPNTSVTAYRASVDYGNTFPDTAQGDYMWSYASVQTDANGFVANPSSTGAFWYGASAAPSKSSTVAGDYKAQFTDPQFRVVGYAKQLTVNNNRDLEDIKLQGTLDTFSSYNPSRLATVSATTAAAVTDACLNYFGYDSWNEVNYPEAKIMSKTALLIAKNRGILTTAQKTACGW